MLHQDGNGSRALRQCLDEYRKTVPEGERACVWAEAGVVPYKLCDGAFDCQNCLFDMVMRGDWTFTAGRLSSRGGKIAPNCFYHANHTWARVVEKANVRIGLDDFGQQLLGRIEKISLPIKGEKLGRKCIRLKGRGGVFSLTPPVEGFVLEVNETLITQPELANTSPYDKGWMVLVRPSGLEKNLRNLIFGQNAYGWFEEDVDRFAVLLADLWLHNADREVGRTEQDGGAIDFSALDYLAPTKIRKVIGSFLGA